MSLDDMLFQIALAEGRYTDPLGLSRHAAQVYSQNGEDGMIAEIFSRIGTRDKFFVEFGIEDGTENNTRLLLESGWNGVWLDANKEATARAADTFHSFIASGALKIVNHPVTKDNVNILLESNDVPRTFDFLSLDIDQNTHHVWQSLQFTARACCVEYNAAIPPVLELGAPYDPEKFWDGTNWFGAGLGALENIGRRKDLDLVGCDLLGINAFFVGANETSGKFREPFTAVTHWEPLRHGLVGRRGHPAAKAARLWSATSAA